MYHDAGRSRAHGRRRVVMYHEAGRSRRPGCGRL